MITRRAVLKASLGAAAIALPALRPGKPKPTRTPTPTPTPTPTLTPTPTPTPTPTVQGGLGLSPLGQNPLGA
jgi:hypothetical protein